MLNAQTYSTLWKQVKDAQDNDLPKTEQEVLGKIVTKAEKEKAYGQLLKAELQRAKSQCEVAPDSLKPVVEQLQERAAQAENNHVLQAIYHTVLGYIYINNRWLDELRHEQIGQEYYEKAVAYPDELAQVKATGFEPFVIKGEHSRYFGNDLLSVIGLMTNHPRLLHDYYVKAGNRQAALIASDWMLSNEKTEDIEQEPLNKSKYIQRLDSLIAEYQDLPECGELAITRYDYMEDHTDATAEQKWQYINMALERWGSWQRMNYLRNRQHDLVELQYNAHVEKYVHIPQRAQNIELTNLRGISQLTVRVYKVDVDGTTELNPSNPDHYKKLKPLLHALPEKTVTKKFDAHPEYEIFEDSMLLGGLPVGVYMLEFESLPATRISRSLYFVSDLRVLSLTAPSNRPHMGEAAPEEMPKRIVVVNATTGQPVKNASVEVRWGWGQKAGKATLKTDSKGECMLQPEKDASRFRMRAYTPTDNACPEMDDWGRYHYNEVNEENQIDIFTDRSIYRPGQTVHAAVILYRNFAGNDNRALANEELTIRLKDANYETVEEKTVTTDEFGTASTSFTLPSQGLTGQFTINVRQEQHSIRVEEYKRPTFEVDIPRVTQDYAAGDTVEATGHVRSYAGVPVQGATVKYKVVRRMAFWWMSYSRYWQRGYFGTGSDDELMAEGETTTDDKGQFKADIPLVVPQTQHPMFYNFVITADVTDQAGETHQGTMSVPLGNRKTAFNVSLPEKVLNEDKTKITFHLQNAGGADLEAQVRYRFDNGSWQEVKTNNLVVVPSLKSGLHTLSAICQEDTIKQEFIVFSLNDKRPVTETHKWFYTSHEQFPNDGKPVTVQVGSSDKDVHVVYAIFSGNKLIESGRDDISNELINRKFTYKEEYGHGLLLTYAWVKDGEYYTYHTTIKEPLPDKRLSVKWKTFRNRLTPGQQEEWTLTITGPEGGKLEGAAQLMATLYDKSLDQLYGHSWSLQPPTRLNYVYTSWGQAQWGTINAYGSKTLPSLSVPLLHYNHFDYDVFPEYHYYLRHRGPLRMMRKDNAMADGEEVLYAAAQEEMEADESYDLAEVPMASQKASHTGGSVEKNEEEPKQAEMQMRENLQETAFFMPQLVTDATGTVSMKFTLPESLTTWRFMGIAHTKDMMYGQISDEAVARKDVMIQPNIPRFLRQDDEGTISARVMNMSDKPVEGTAMLQLLDPETEAVVYEQKQQVSIADSSTTAVTFNIAPSTFHPQPSTLLIARVSISTPKHSDGEQHYLPILPSTERVTVTVPFTQNGPGTKEVDLTKIISPSTLHTSPSTTLTVEYTNNPAWLMIQALPAVGHPLDDCAMCQATSYYANAIGRHILAQNPTAKNVFEQWKRETTQLTSLNSQLQKNEELKDLLLNETPWVMDANREQEQKQQLGVFFDKNAIDMRLSSAMKKLNGLQNDNGSWSWWPGMNGSPLITTSVTEMLVRLNQMTEQQDETEEMLDNAFTFLGNNIVELVKEMKKEERKGHKQTFPNFRALQWLYICAIDGRELPKDVADANAYLTNLLKKETKNQTIYEKALSAIILKNKTYVKSLKEWTVYREDMGRYYDTQRAGYSWRDYKMPTQVAAIEAMKLLTPNDTITITEMQRWLLQQKRTQAWDTPLNSVDAIYAFLNGNSQALAPQEKTELCIDDKPLDTSDATAGIGYVKTTIPLLPEGGARGGSDFPSTFTAKKTSTGTSWGAVYAQFTQPTRDIADQTSGISVKRELYTAGNLSPLTSQHSPLKEGDKVTVRITIEADRDYDFVQLTDKRAACMEPVKQLSGYNWREGYYCTPKDYATSYFFDLLPKGRHIIETEYYIDRTGTYETGTCTVQCAYSPEFHGTTKSISIQVKDKE
ncbi:MAG: alpha-2-macroglobulin [Prevotella sp.]|nr:alpha-2-macroglobulin [Prevotella sp.]